MIKCINGNNKLIISHIADIDGMGSIILANKYFHNEIDYILAEIKDLKEIFTSDLSRYETIFVCDLTLVDDVLEVLTDEELIKKIIHFDHHKTMINDHMPSFVNYVIEINGKKTCGTELYYNYLLSLSNELNTSFYKTLVEGIRANDTWDKNGDFELGRVLASIHAMIGPEPFIKFILSLDDSKEFSIPEVYQNFVNADTEKMNRYIENANQNLLITNYEDKKIGVTISEQYRSILGDELNKKNPDLAFILIINFERMSVSLRTINEDIDLCEICKEFHHDGGGHKKAAGFIIDKESLEKLQPYIDEYMNKIKNEK